MTGIRDRSFPTAIELLDWYRLSDQREAGCRRFTLRGMSWYRRGVSHLLCLGILRLNGTWAGDWTDRFAAALRPWPSAA